MSDLASRDRARRERNWHEDHLPIRGAESTSTRAFSEYWETPGGRVRYARRLKMIRAEISDRVHDVLLIGCGYGSWISDLIAMGLRVHAVDISPSIVGRAVTRTGTRDGLLMCADAHELPFSESAFDAVVSISTLHHLVPAVAVPELRRVLRPSGVLLGSEPNIVNPQVRWMLSSSARRERGGLTPDETAFCKAQLLRELQRSFDDVSVVPFDFWHPRLGYRREGHLLIRLVRTLEIVPVVREYAGSLWFTARRLI